MNILCGEVKIKRDIYEYKVNEGGESDLETANDHSSIISISFINDKFEEVLYDFGGDRSRSLWHILQAIGEKISELEEKYKEDKP